MRHNVNSPVKPKNRKGTNHGMFRVVDSEKVRRIATDHRPESILVVDRLKNEATPVLILGEHFYYRIRNKQGRIVWIRHLLPEETLIQKPLEERTPEEQIRVAYWLHWQAYNYFVDFKKRIKENAALFSGELVDPLDTSIILNFNP